MAPAAGQGALHRSIGRRAALWLSRKTSGGWQHPLQDGQFVSKWPALKFIDHNNAGQPTPSRDKSKAVAVFAANATRRPPTELEVSEPRQLPAIVLVGQRPGAEQTSAAIAQRRQKTPAELVATGAN